MRNITTPFNRLQWDRDQRGITDLGPSVGSTPDMPSERWSLKKWLRGSFMSGGPQPGHEINMGMDNQRLIQPVPPLFIYQFSVQVPDGKQRPTNQVQRTRINDRSVRNQGNIGEDDSPYDDPNEWVGSRYATDGSSTRQSFYTDEDFTAVRSPGRENIGIRVGGGGGRVF